MLEVVGGGLLLHEGSPYMHDGLLQDGNHSHGELLLHDGQVLHEAGLP